MQSRLIVSKLNKILFQPPKYEQILRSSFSSASSSSSSGFHGEKYESDDAMTQGVDREGETGDPKPEDDNRGDIISTEEDDRYIHPKTVPQNLSSSKLETPGVNTPIDPHIQQKRSKSTLKKEDMELTCAAGIDGSPWPEDEKGGTGTTRKEQEEDDKVYFKQHKASPLSDIEIVDSRKPVTRVQQGTAGGSFGDEQVMTWKPEQVDTAEESLLRAMKMFREAAARGVPEWPHSRRLRQLRGEDW